MIVVQSLQASFWKTVNKRLFTNIFPIKNWEWHQWLSSSQIVVVSSLEYLLQAPNIVTSTAHLPWSSSAELRPVSYQVWWLWSTGENTVAWTEIFSLKMLSFVRWVQLTNVWRNSLSVHLDIHFLHFNIISCMFPQT